MKCLIFVLFFSFAALPAFADEYKNGTSEAPSSLDYPGTRKPTDRNLDALIGGRYEDVIKNVQTQYACQPLSANPSTRAQEIMSKFELPRTDEERKYQAFCWESAENTIKALKGKDDILANKLTQKLKTNRDSIKTLRAVNSCPGPDSELRDRLKKQLEIGTPLDTFRTIPVKVPPEVTEQESARQLRDAIYSESMVQSLERSIVLAKSHGIGFSNIVDKICPADSVCAKGKHGRDLRAYLQARYDSLKNAPIPRIPDSVVSRSLENAVHHMDQDAQKFNSQLRCYEAGSAMVGSNRICNTKTTDQDVAALNKNYYDNADKIMSTDTGSLLGQEPYKSQLKTMYGGIPVTLNGETTYAFFKKHNEPPGWDPLYKKTAWEELPSNLRLLGGPESVREAAQNALKNTVKFTGELNKIEASIRKGKDPDYGIFSSGDPELKGLALMASLNPEATARVLLSNPQIAQTDTVCKMLNYQKQMESNKELRGKIEMVAGLTVGVAGFVMTLAPTGITQIVGPEVIAVGGELAIGAGVGMATWGTGFAAKDWNDNRISANRTEYAYSATNNTDLKYDSEKANSAMMKSAGIIAGNAAGAFLIAFNKGIKSLLLLKKNEAVLAEAVELKTAGKFALEEAVDSPEAMGTLMNKAKDPTELDEWNKLATEHPDAVKEIMAPVKDCAGGGK